jgi:hypothetical protein
MTYSTDDGSIYILYVIMALPLLIIFPIVVRIISRLRTKGLSRSRTIIAVYQSPKNLTPAEIGYLYDASLGAHEVAATVFDLEYKDIVTIDKTGAISITALNTQNLQLKSHERFMLQCISRGTYTSILQDMNILDLQLFKQQVGLGLVGKDLIRERFYQRVFFGSLRMIRNVFFFYSSLIIFGIASLLFQSLITFGEFMLMVTVSLIGFTFIFTPLYVALGIFLTFIYVKLDGMRWIGTKRLRRTWPDIEGYRMYIKQAQLNRLNFASEELRIKALERDFAYAVALRMRIDWKSRFKSS